jgi:hypothetical protein
MRVVAVLLVVCGLFGCSSSPDIRGRNAEARAWAESERRDEAARKQHRTLPRTSKSVASPENPPAPPPAPSAPPPAVTEPAAR